MGAGSDFVMDIATESDSRIADANGAWQAACDTDVIDWNKANEFIIALLAKCNVHAGCSATLRVQWRRDSEGVWRDLGTTGELVQGTGTVLTNCTSPSGYTSGCQNLEDSHEIEGDNDAVLSTTGKTYVELDCAVDPSNALDGETYSFRIYDVTAGAPVEAGPWDAQITIAAAVTQKDFADSGSGSDAFANPYRAMGFSEVGGGADGFGVPFKALGFSDVGEGADAFAVVYREVKFSDVGSGADVFFLLQEKEFSDVGSGSDAFAIVLKSLGFSDAGQGADAFLIPYKELGFQDAGSGADAFAIVLKALGFSDAGSGVDAFAIPYKEIPFSDVGAGGDVFGKQILGAAIEKNFSDVGGGIDVFSIHGKINYDSVNNVISVIGFTQALPCTFEDLYQSSVAGGWGVISKQGDIQYFFIARIKIGNNSKETWFADTLKQVSWGEGTLSANYQSLIEVTGNAHFRDGILENEAKKTTSSGCSFFLKHPLYTTTYMVRVTSATGEAHLYSSHFSRDAFYLYFSGENIRLWNCVLAKSCQIYVPAMSIDVFNTIITQAPSYAIYRPQGNYNKITITNSAYAAYLRPAGTMKNLFARDLSTAFLICSFLSDDFNLIDADTDTWSIIWSGVNTGRVVRQYTFNLKVTEKDGTPINGAIVTLKDKDDNQIFQVTTDADGKIAEQTVSRGWYEQATGSTLNEYSPHTLMIEKAGYQTYVKKFMLDKTNWEIKLTKAVGVFLDFGRPVINLKKSDPENKNVMVL